MWERIVKTFKSEDGATMVEYALMLGLIAVVCIAVVTSLGQTVLAKFTAADNALK